MGSGSVNSVEKKTYIENKSAPNEIISVLHSWLSYYTPIVLDQIDLITVQKQILFGSQNSIWLKTMRVVTVSRARVCVFACVIVFSAIDFRSV